jgi:hypothetical protein
MKPFVYAHPDAWYRQEAEAIAREARQAAKPNGRGPRPSKNTASPIGDGVEAETLRFRTAAELARDAPPALPWIVPGFLAPGVVTELDGKLKASGKTTFVSHMVKAALAGAPFLGSPTRPTGVLWLTEERHTSFLETLKRAGLADATNLHLLLWHDVKARRWPAVVAEAVRYAQQMHVGILIVDTISQFAGLRGDSENNSGDALAAAEPLQLAAAQGLAVVAVRHERKGGGDVGESGRGSSAFSGAVDIVVSLRRAEGHTKPTVRVLHTLSRFTETPETLVIDLTETGYVALGSQGTVAILEAERAILELLPETPEGALPVKDLCAGPPRLTRSVAQKALKSLTEAGLVTVTGTGTRGDAYCYSRAVNVSASTQTSKRGRKAETPKSLTAEVQDRGDDLYQKGWQ